MLKYLMFYEDRGIEVVRGEGQYVWDSAGRKYIDMHTGHGVAFLGHRHPHIVKSLTEQMGLLMTASTSFRVRVREEMLDRLSRVAPRELEYVYLLNSGSEAVDFALKAARKATERKKLVYFLNSFHGRTLGALSVTGNYKYRSGFEPLIPETVQLKFNEVEGLDKNVDETVAAVIVEPIQGEGGIHVASPEFLRALRKRTEEVGALLILDEVQTGFGRTGSVWAFEYYGIMPDILVAGKAIGGGFPVSAVFLRKEVAIKLERGSHGSTYGGNPLACAAVKAAAEVLLEESVPERAKVKGAHFIRALSDKLRGNPLVREVRGAGLMIGVDLRREPTPIIKCLQDRGLLALKAGASVLRLLPPYLITEDDIAEAVGAVHECLSELGSAAAAGSA